MKWEVYAKIILQTTDMKPMSTGRQDEATLLVEQKLNDVGYITMDNDQKVGIRVHIKE